MLGVTGANGRYFNALFARTSSNTVQFFI